MEGGSLRVVVNEELKLSKNAKRKTVWGGWGSGGGRVAQGGCERGMEVIGKCKKKKSRGVRVDVNEKLK